MLALRRIVFGLVVMTASAGLSYFATRSLRAIGREGGAASRQISPSPPSGRHLIAFVLLSSECGFCTEKHTKRALADLRDSLIRAHGQEYEKLSVMGIAIDRDIDKGMKYLRGLRGSAGSAFDELSVGGLWLNEMVTSLVWRDGVTSPSVPQVILVEREVDATGYPRHIEVHADSLVFKVQGRDSLIAWVARGTPLPLRSHPL